MTRDLPYGAGEHGERRLDLHWPAGLPSATVLFIHGGSLLESGERRSSPRYRDVCAPFVAARDGDPDDLLLFGLSSGCTLAAVLEQGARFVRRLLEEDVPADLVVVPGTHRSSIEDLDVPGDSAFRAIRSFMEETLARAEGGG